MVFLICHFVTMRHLGLHPSIMDVSCAFKWWKNYKMFSAGIDFDDTSFQTAHFNCRNSGLMDNRGTLLSFSAIQGVVSAFMKMYTYTHMGMCANFAFQ